MNIYFKTFGCRTNIYDTELLKSFINKDNTIVNDELGADIVIVNSCTVTNGADSDVLNYIRGAKRRAKMVLLTGCGVDSWGQKWVESGVIDGVFGMSQKSKINEFINSIKNGAKIADLGVKEFSESAVVARFSTHTKGFIKIQEGCDFSCSYCIIPSVRGKSRSVPANIILDQAKKLIQNGFSELVLTGTNMGSYRSPSGDGLGKLLQDLGKISGLKRLRLGSLEPSQIDSAFKEILDEPFLERHLHIAVQHTSDKMLKIMRRKNHFEKDAELFGELRAKGFALGTDFIVGHPGESDEIWAEALNGFKMLNLTHLHAFIFSPRNGTRSAAMSDKVAISVARSRLKTLNTIVEQNNLAFRKRLSTSGTELKILIEKRDKNGLWVGRDQFYNAVNVDYKGDLAHQWIGATQWIASERANIASVWYNTPNSEV